MLIMRRATRALAAVGAVCLLLIAVPAMAAPPLPDAGISVAEDSAGPVQSLATADQLTYGDTVSFDWWLDGKVAKNSYLTIGLLCTQDGEMVYSWYGQPDFAFPLIDQNASQWSWDGRAAECTASLRYYANNRLNIVATTTFGVAGG